MRWADIIVTTALMLLLLPGCSAHLQPPAAATSCDSGLNLTGYKFHFRGYYQNHLTRHGSVYRLEVDKNLFWSNFSVDFSLRNSAFDSTLSCEAGHFYEQTAYRRCSRKKDHGAHFLFHPKDFSLSIIYSWSCPGWRHPKSIRIGKTMDCVRARAIDTLLEGFVTCWNRKFKLILTQRSQKSSVLS
ncbi:hypothetical protein XA68_17395 [Ophiocordyceps unilateralis]|uniref:AA1-like domain-containing protein n=1 Tax=Ophiocordyceps unilateralis TaxID=268505 RepID=A0A2A9P4W1_OPHUN|nr:hypothetical protein XA68_17395 [Ophiocordyceps unilateralis]